MKENVFLPICERFSSSLTYEMPPKCANGGQSAKSDKCHAREQMALQCLILVSRRLWVVIDWVRFHHSSVVRVSVCVYMNEYFFYQSVYSYFCIILIYHSIWDFLLFSIERMPCFFLEKYWKVTVYKPNACTISTYNDLKRNTVCVFITIQTHYVVKKY